jgi:hypothetical protein
MQPSQWVHAFHGTQQICQPSMRAAVTAAMLQVGLVLLHWTSMSDGYLQDGYQLGRSQHHPLVSPADHLAAAVALSADMVHVRA